MNMIQKKFLISLDITRWFNTQKQLKQQCIEKFYTHENSCYYLKIFPSTYHKVHIDGKGQEQYSIISQENYTQNRARHRGKILLKNIYTMAIDDITFTFFEYLESLKGLTILITKFKNEISMRNSDTVKVLEAFILKSIDKDHKYTEKLLASCIKPFEYNLSTLFEKIDAFESANLFFWQVPIWVYVRDGITLILYKNIRLLNHYKMSYQHKHFTATLHRLRVIMSRTATLLETFSELFDPSIQNFCTQSLRHYYLQTKRLRYLYFLQDLYSTQENKKLSLQSELKSLLSQEESNVTQMLLSQPFTQLIQVLTRTINTQEYPQCQTLKEESKRVIQKRLEVFERLLQKTKKGYDDTLLEKIYLSIDTLQTLLEDFFHLIGEKKVQIIVDELNILLKPLREYRNCQERKAIMQEIKQQSNYSLLDIEPLLCTKTKALQEKIKNALKLLRASRFYV